MLRRTLLTLTLAALAAAPLSAQNRNQNRGQPPASLEGKRNPKYLEWHNPKYLTLQAKINLRSYQEQYAQPDQPIVFDVWNIQMASIVFPILKSAGNAEAEEPLDPAAPPTEGIESRLTFNDREHAGGLRFIDQFPVGARYGLWTLGSPNGEMLQGREMQLIVRAPMIVYRTKYHDDAAEAVDWPKQGWPEIAQSAFQPMGFIDHGLGPTAGRYDMQPIRDLLKEWTGSDDPNKWKELKPAVLAKFLAGKVVEHYQLSGQGLGFNKNGQIESVVLSPIDAVAKAGRGTPFEMACLLTAVYREAGIPARIVIGVRSGKGGDLDFLGNNDKNEGELHAWSEWCLYDEKDKSVTWIPVDIAEIRKTSSRMRRNYWQQSIRYFGTHDKMDALVPMTFHFFPPTSVQSYSSSGSPGFWGWLASPATPERAVQALTFSVTSSPNRGDRRKPQPK